MTLAPSNNRLGRAIIEEREKPGKPRDRYRYRGPWSPDRPTVAYIGDFAIGLAVVEMSEDVLVRYVGGKYIRETDYVPPKSPRRAEYTWTTTQELASGRLRIIAYCPYSRVDWTMIWDETARADLPGHVTQIVKAVKAAVPELVARLTEADRLAEIERRKQDAEHERWKRKRDREQIVESVSKSREQLSQVIARWSGVMDIERFFASVEARAADLDAEQQAFVLERLKLAREFLGSQNPLDLFMNWKTPGEIYQPRYSDADEEGGEDT